MTVSTAPTPLSYSTDGSPASYPITWKYNAKSHVVATLRSAAGAETVWALTTNYTLTAPGDSGTLTPTVIPDTGQTLVITLEPPNTQSSDIPLGGDFPSTTVEDGLDLAAQRDGKIEALFLRALRVPKTDTQTGSLLEIPIDSLRASKFLSFDANGKPIAAAGTSANLGPVSTFVDTLLDDTTAGVFVETLRGDLSAETVTADDDEVLLRDTSATTGKRMTFSNFIDRILTVARAFTAAHTHSGAETHSGPETHSGAETFVTLALSSTLSSTKAAAADYSRVTPNMCRRTSLPAYTSLVRDTNTLVTGPTGAVGLILLLNVIAKSNNAIADRSTYVTVYSDSGATITIAEARAACREQAATAAGTVLLEISPEVHVKCDSSYQVRLIFTDDSGNQGTAGYIIAGYYD